MVIKRTFWVLLGMALLLTAWPASTAFAADAHGRIRVGLAERHTGAQSVFLGRQDVLMGYDAGWVFHGESVLLPDNTTVVPAWGFYVIAESFSTHAEAAQSGFPGGVLIHDAPNSWHVAAGPFSQADADADAAARGGRVIGMGHRSVALTAPQPFIVFTNEQSFAQMAGRSGMLALGDRQYRGVMEFTRSGSSIMPVNVVPMDEYLYSVVPSEMPASWHIEALKAQAIAARSYTVSRSATHHAEGFHMCDTVHCQVYRGAGAEHPSSTHAVRATSGVMARHNGRVIGATYFSSSGGVTEHSEHVWQNAVPYLRSVREVAETEHRQWSRSFSMADLTAILQAENIQIGQATGLSIASHSPSGRVTELTITGTSGSHTVVRDAIRWFFRHGPGGPLESNNFTLADGLVGGDGGTVAVLNNQTQAVSDLPLSGLYAIAATGNAAPIQQAQVTVRGRDGTHMYNTAGQTTMSVFGGRVSIAGRGWGHGVGMSQFGARGMAEAGYTHIQILKHYYTGIEVY